MVDWRRPRSIDPRLIRCYRRVLPVRPLDEHASWLWRRPVPGAIVLAVLLVGLFAWGEVFEPGPELGGGRWALLLGGSLLSVWGAALLIDHPPGPLVRTPRSVGWSIAAVLIGFPVFALFGPIDAIRPGVIGTGERLVLLPAVIAALVAAARALRLRGAGWVAVLLSQGVIVGSGDWTAPAPEYVQAASGPTLAAIARSGEPIPLPAITHPERDRVYPDPRAGLDCQRVALSDLRRSAFGILGRGIDVTTDVCWGPRGQPASVLVISRAANGNATGIVAPVQVSGFAGFGATATANERLATGADQGDGEVSSTHPIRADGTVATAGAGRNPVRVMVSRDGRTVRVVTGWLERDWIVANSNQADRALEHAPASVTVGSPHPRHGELLDVYAATITRGAAPDARLVQIDPGGTQRRLAGPQGTLGTDLDGTTATVLGGD